MDNSNNSSGGQNAQAVAPTSAEGREAGIPAAPAAPVAPAIGISVRPEQGPVASVSTHEVMKPAGEHVEPAISPEVSAAGVEAQKDVPNLTLTDQKQPALQPAGDVAPHPTAPAGIVSLSEAELRSLVKKKNVRSSRWWAIKARLRQVLRLKEAA